MLSDKGWENVDYNGRQPLTPADGICSKHIFLTLSLSHSLTLSLSLFQDDSWLEMTPDKLDSLLKAHSTEDVCGIDIND